mmetsp:Transcript_113082/g.365251  ORF Transcript_113082/g.365251 Transcript_113082/m.365251 type:complete len:100 (-) Transcript_113082:973-1272(-)
MDKVTGRRMWRTTALEVSRVRRTDPTVARVVHAVVPEEALAMVCVAVPAVDPAGVLRAASAATYRVQRVVVPAVEPAVAGCTPARLKTRKAAHVRPPRS